MAEPKTRVTNASVPAFFNALADPQTRKDCRTIAGIMRAATGAKPRMWGTSIVGFGTHKTVYANGRTADWPLIGFAPRKQNITLYLMAGFQGRERMLRELGAHKSGGGCLYIRRLSDIHLPTLRKLVNASVRQRIKTSREH